MDPVSSSSSTSTTPPNHDNSRLNRQIKTTQPVADRVARALRHPFFLLHRSDSNFFILDATGNVYAVTLCATPSCNCPDRTTPCKHIICPNPSIGCLNQRRVSLEEDSPAMSAQPPSRSPTLPEELAGANLRERFHQLIA